MAYQMSRGNNPIGHRLRTTVEERLINCPYNTSHLILYSKLGNHLQKCRKNYRLQMAYQNKPIMIVQCRFNKSHWAVEVEDRFHFDTCVDRNRAPVDLLGQNDVYAPRSPRLESDLLGQVPGGVVEDPSSWPEDALGVPTDQAAEVVDVGGPAGRSTEGPEVNDGASSNVSWELQFDEQHEHTNVNPSTSTDGTPIPRAPEPQVDGPAIPPEYFADGFEDSDDDDEMSYFTVRHHTAEAQPMAAVACGSTPPNRSNNSAESFGFNPPPGQSNQRVYYVSQSEVLDRGDDDDEVFTPDNLVQTPGPSTPIVTPPEEPVIQDIEGPADYIDYEPQPSSSYVAIIDLPELGDLEHLEDLF